MAREADTISPRRDQYVGHWLCWPRSAAAAHARQASARSVRAGDRRASEHMNERTDRRTVPLRKASALRRGLSNVKARL